MERKSENTVGNGKELLRKRMNHLKRRNKSRKLSQPAISYFLSDLIPESCSLPAIVFFWMSIQALNISYWGCTAWPKAFTKELSKIILISELSVLCHTHTVQWLCIVFPNLTVRSNARKRKKENNNNNKKFLPLV